MAQDGHAHPRPRDACHTRCDCGNCLDRGLPRNVSVPGPTVTATVTVSPSFQQLVYRVNAANPGEMKGAILTFLQGPDGKLFVTVNGKTGSFEKAAGRITVTSPKGDVSTLSQADFIQSLQEKLDPDPGAMPNAAPTRPQPIADRNKPTEEDSDPDLQMLSWKLGSGPIGKQITGKIRNNSSRDYQNIKLEFTLYDKDDNIVGTAISYSSVYVPRVPRGKIWFFETASISGISESKTVRAEFASAKEE